VSDARLLETFLELVRIDSPPGSEVATARYCEAALQAAGCEVWFDDSAATTGSDTGNLIALLPGTLPGTLAFSAHMDVVEPCRGIEPIVVDGMIVSAGPTVLGADNRSGLAPAIEIIRRIAESGQPHPSIRVLFTVQEEVGLLGAKSLRPEDVACDLCLVLDAEGAPGGIVVAAPTHYTFTAEFRGRACHAGVCPEQGVSAITVATNAISRMELGRLDADTTANIGSIRGGTATNVVAGRCDVTGECRSLDRARVEVIREAMTSAMHDAADEAGAEVDIVWTREYEGFLHAEDAPEVELVSRACRLAGFEPRTYRTGGGSDANILAAMGIPVIALACGMTGVHGTQEQISIADLEAITSIAEQVVALMSAEQTS
jgi:tripeptide aminopeptidase